MKILAINAGSTSLKLGLFEVDGGGCEALHETQIDSPDFIAAADQISHWAVPEAVAHRIVHGGRGLRRHAMIDRAVIDQLEAAKALAPLHVPPALDAVAAARARWPDAPQVACLDDAFHATLPPAASTLSIGEAARAAGVERYGFHGLSCASIVRRLGAELPQRLVIAHLGGGCSVTAVRAGASVDTTMGLTPAGGIMMASRAGDLDPGALVFLMRQGWGADAIEDLVDRRSGLIGVSGESKDVRELRASGSQGARLALDMFALSAAKGVAAMMVALGGTELIVFTGGVGEHDQETREAVMAHLAFAGPPPARAMPAEEEAEMARIAYALTSNGRV